MKVNPSDVGYMRRALNLARRGYGATSPNPMVGAVVVKGGRILGQGWHHRAGEPHAEIEALRHVEKRGEQTRGATLYVTLEPCCTHGRTPPCTEAIIAAGIRRVVVGATDPNPRHCGKAFSILKRAGLAVTPGVLASECENLNEAFNHWIVYGTPFVLVKSAMTLDGKIATASGESKWITGELARACAMKLRQGADAILVGINTVLMDDPALTVRDPKATPAGTPIKTVRRIILDSQARTPLTAKVVSDRYASRTTIVVSADAPKSRVRRLAQCVEVVVAPSGSRGARPGRVRPQTINLRWLLKRLGREGVTSLLVEGGGEVNASFLLSGLAQRIAFFYAPKVLGGAKARKAVAGDGAASAEQTLDLQGVKWRLLGEDWLLTAKIAKRGRSV